MARKFCNRANKEMFPTQLDADLAISAIRGHNARRRKQRFRDEPKRSYQCEFCFHWHMTSQEKRSDETVSN
jgi:hypothetical protein